MFLYLSCLFFFYGAGLLIYLLCKNMVKMDFRFWEEQNFKPQSLPSSYGIISLPLTPTLTHSFSQIIIVCLCLACFCWLSDLIFVYRTTESSNLTWNMFFWFIVAHSSWGCRYLPGTLFRNACSEIQLSLWVPQLFKGTKKFIQPVAVCVSAAKDEAN